MDKQKLLDGWNEISRAMGYYQDPWYKRLGRRLALWRNRLFVRKLKER